MRHSIPLLGPLAAACLLAASAAPAAEPFPGAEWPRAEPVEVGLDGRRIDEARRYALSAGGAGIIVRYGRLVASWGDVRERFDLKSTTKSFGALALALAAGDGKVRLADRANGHHPSLGVPPDDNRATGWIGEITIAHLATHTAGFEKPGGYGKLLFRPGTEWSYSDGGPNWLAEAITLAYRRDLADLLFERVFEPIGIGRRDLVWRENSYRPHRIEGIPRREFGSGISASADALARVGYLVLHEGRWRGREVLPAGLVRAFGVPAPGLAGLSVRHPEEYGAASSHYGLLWWNNGDGTLPGVPRDAFWSWGLHDSLIAVIPSLRIVAARAGRSWERTSPRHYDVLEPFLGPISAAARAPPPAVPPSPVIAGIEWDPPERIVRLAKGSDNWPLTWAGDGALYGAYGDGNGFAPGVPEKLSLGLARIDGMPPDITGVNLRAPTLETTGDGERGRKASGILMVDGVLYLLARNAGNSELAWSSDRGATWTWSGWRFTESFGCPTFLNFGPDYAGARDRFVYVYSHDSPSAYERADRMVLARVPKGKLPDREAYEFFAGLDAGGGPRWSPDVAGRAAVFESRGRCYRSSVSYDAGIGRYLWCQTGPGEDPRFRGGIAIHDAPEPWGPWTVAYAAEEWDVGPGESQCLPVKWMSADGRTVHLVFSGDDAFSVRRARLVLR
jgi:CubicO group peptidase (beta-lactamase class C family)